MDVPILVIYVLFASFLGSSGSMTPLLSTLMSSMPRKVVLYKQLQTVLRIGSSRLHSCASWSASTEGKGWRVTCNTDEDVEDLGRRMAPHVGNADVILLKGDLGAGKTTFSRGLIRSKFDDEGMRVTSPSYLLDNTYEYDEGMYIHHMDLYRLPTGCDLSMLGIPDIYSTSLCLIEWPQRMGGNVPTDYLDVHFKINADESRCITLTPYGQKWLQKLPLVVDVAHAKTEDE